MIRKTILVLSALLISGIAFAQPGLRQQNQTCPRNPSGQCLRAAQGAKAGPANGMRRGRANGMRRGAGGGMRGCWRGNL
jgi:hypothetical protein